MQELQTSVLVVGGGPAGLTAALLLARAAIPVILVERHATTSIHPRARGLNVRTMEIFRSLGLEDQIRKAGSALSQSRYMLFVETLAGREIRRVPDDDLMLTDDQLGRITPCTWVQCAQDELEPLLADSARAAGADLRFNTELSRFTQATDGIIAIVADRVDGAPQTIRAEYMIAADGAKSAIRAALGIPFNGRGGIEHYINAYFRADLRPFVKDRWFGICFVENTESPGMFLAVNNRDRWLFNMEYKPEHGQSAADYIPERCTDLIRKAVGVPDLSVELFSVLPWEAEARIADKFRVERVFLTGDAAHVMPPAGGFGLNTGVQDVHNLAWKLAAVLNGTEDTALLDSYEIERKPVAQTVIRQAVDELQAPSPDTPPVDPTDETPDGPPDCYEPDPEKAMIAQIKVVLGYRYESCAVIPDHTQPVASGLDLNGRPGTRAPHVWLNRDDTRLSTLDWFGSQFVLLTANPEWIDAARHINLVVQQISADGDISAAYRLSANGAALIRPDGFIGWRSTTKDVPAHLQSIVRSLGCQST